MATLGLRPAASNAAITSEPKGRRLLPVVLEPCDQSRSSICYRLQQVARLDAGNAYIVPALFAPQPRRLPVLPEQRILFFVLPHRVIETGGPHQGWKAVGVGIRSSLLVREIVLLSLFGYDLLVTWQRTQSPRPASANTTVGRSLVPDRSEKGNRTITTKPAAGGPKLHPLPGDPNRPQVRPR